MEVGDRVEIIRTDINDLYHRKRPVYGRITGINGEYIYVKPSWCRWVIELYRSEINPCLSVPREIIPSWKSILP